VYVLDIVRARVESRKVLALIKSVAARDGRRVEQDLPQDPGQAGKSQKAAIASELHGFTVRFSPETGSKETRAQPLASQAEAGNLYLVRAPWNDAFVAEAIVFNRGDTNDQVDAASRAYARLLKGSGSSEIPIAPTIIMEG
jgi:predicted phage terminase large subunit-like protein